MAFTENGMMMKNKADYQKSLTHDPTQDGVTHINVHYNIAHTQLGRMASTFFGSMFTHPYFGPFKCVEGFLLFVKTGCRDDAFRNLTGAKAKSYFRRLVENEVVKERDVPNLERLLVSAHYAKALRNEQFKELLIESTLPFDQYYLHGVGNIPIRPPGTEAMINSLNTVREHLKNGTEPETLTNDEYAQMIQR